MITQVKHHVKKTAKGRNVLVKAHSRSLAGKGFSHKSVQGEEFKERVRFAEKGQSLPDGSFPIGNDKDLSNAIKAYGRAKNPAKVKAFIKKRAKQLNKVSQLPEKWKH